MEKEEKLRVNLKRIWKYIKKSRINLFGYAFVSIVEALISVVLPLISSKLILNITDGLFDQLIITSLIVFAISIALYICFFFKGFFYRKIYNKTMNLLKIDVAKNILMLEISDIDRESSGLFIDRLNNDTEEISGVFMEFAYWLSYVITNIGVLVTIFFLNRIVFAFSFITSLVTYLIRKKRINKGYEINKKIKKLNEKTTSLTSEVIRGIRDIKVLNASKSVLNELEDRIVDASNEKANLIKNDQIFSFFENSSSALADLLFMILGVYLCKNSLLTIPSFVILYNYQGKVQGLWNGIASLSEYLKKFSLAATRIFEIVESIKYHKETFGIKHLDNVVGNIEFKNVNFAYANGKKVLNKISFHIEENKTIAIVGKSGVGKTTIFSLMAKLYHPSNGKIFIDGVNINDLDEASIRDNIAIITQNPYIFNFSIKENFLLTSPNATDEEIINACRIASLDEFINTLPDKYDTIVGEGGVTLSGGQKQRLAIARALLMKTKIILFDEATSALDNETQEQIQESIRKMKGNFTIVIVAHRLSTIMDADNILVIEDGKVIDSGTHKELMKKSVTYKNLYNKENI